MNIILKNTKALDYIEKIDIISAKLSRIEIEGETEVIGKSYSYTAKGFYDDGSSRDITEFAEWSSNNDTYVTINKGNLTILPSAVQKQNIEIKVSYNGMTCTKSIYVTYDLGLRRDVKIMLEKTSKSISDAQKIAFNEFIQALDDNDIHPEMLYIPAIAGSLDESFINYADSESGYPSDFQPNSEYSELDTKGFRNTHENDDSNNNNTRIVLSRFSKLRSNNFHFLFYATEEVSVKKQRGYPSLYSNLGGTLFSLDYNDEKGVLPAYANHRICNNQNVDFIYMAHIGFGFDLSLKGWNVKGSLSGNEYFTYNPAKNSDETTTETAYNYPDANFSNDISLTGVKSLFCTATMALITAGTGLEDSQVEKYNEIATNLLKSLNIL